MKIGLLDTFSKANLPFWQAFAKELDLDIVLPKQSLSESLAIGQQTLPDEPAYIQLAVARVLELSQTSDVVLIPRTEPDMAAGQVPWLTDFAEVVRLRLSVANAQYVPEDTDALHAAATRLGVEWTRNPQRVRLAWDRTVHLLKVPRHRDPQLQAPSSKTVLVVAPDYLLSEPLLLKGLPEAMASRQLYPVYAREFARESRLQAASRLGSWVFNAEREAAGALALLMGKALIKGVLFPVQEDDALGLKLAKELAKLCRKPTLILPLPKKAALDDIALHQLAVSVQDVSIFEG